MLVSRRSGLHDHGGELALGGDLAVDDGLARELEDVAAVAPHSLTKGM